MTHEHDLGLSHDLPTLLSRRRALGLLGGAGLALLAACSGREGTPTGSSARSGSGAGTGTSAGRLIPEEGRGPFPGDTGGADLLAESGVVRADITSSFGTGSAVAAGVPLTLRLRVLDVSGGSGGGYAGAAVYVWHCDKDGRYSLYEEPVEDENYLRGVQAADADGVVTFRTVFPGAYDGRWPHVHLEVYRDLDAVMRGGILRTSQLAFPEDVCREVYATEGYDRSVRNLSGLSLEGDVVFADGYSLQLARMSGSVDGGLVAALDVPV